MTHILVRSQPLHARELRARIFAAAAAAASAAAAADPSSDVGELGIEDAFEVVCAATAALGGARLFYTEPGRRLLLLLDSVSQALPRLFDVNLVTRRVRALLTKLVNCPPSSELDDQSQPSAAEGEDPLDIAARIVNNLSGETARNHSAELHQFFVVASGDSSAPAALAFEFAIHYGSVHFVNVNTAGLLWPGATAFCALLAAISMPQTAPAAQHPLLAHLARDLAAADAILEVGSGLGMLTCAVASVVQCLRSAPVRVLVTDLHEDVAALAKKNADATMAATAKCSGSAAATVAIASRALNWKDLAACRETKQQVLAPSTASSSSPPPFAVLVASECIYDEEMGVDVARLLRVLLHDDGDDGVDEVHSRRRFAAAYIVVMNKRVGINEFVATCEGECGLRCTRLRDSELPAASVAVAQDSSGGGEALREWSLLAITRAQHR